MVTLQILVLSFLVRVRVPQQKELDCLLKAIQLFCFPPVFSMSGSTIILLSVHACLLYCLLSTLGQCNVFLELTGYIQ